MKKKVLALAVGSALCVSAYSQQEVIINGDLNHDGQITVADVVLLRRVILQSESPEQITIENGELVITPIEVVSVVLTETAVEVSVGYKRRLTAEVYPADARDKTLRWISSDPTVATVTADGVVTGVKTGTATITATAAAGIARAECVVTVVAAGGQTEGSAADIEGDEDW